MPQIDINFCEERAGDFRDDKHRAHPREILRRASPHRSTKTTAVGFDHGILASPTGSVN
jgi:hypothetical protein